MHGRPHRLAAPREDDVDALAHQVRRGGREQVGPVPCVPALEHHVPALDIALLPEPFPQRVPVRGRRLGRADGPRERQIPYPRGRGRLCGGRRREDREGEGRDDRDRAEARGRPPAPSGRAEPAADRDQPFRDALVSLCASATAASGVSTRKTMVSTRYRRTDVSVWLW